VALLTVICPCYNQEKFIGQTLEGFVGQKTDFDFIALVGDDASTDGTPAIVGQYAEKHPNLVRPVLRAGNLGPGGNVNDLYKRVSSKYVAICEGDDYWTDERKLQKQVDFMEANPGCALSFHPVAVWNEREGRQDGIFPDRKTRFDKSSLGLADLLRHNFIQTNSVVYRWRFRENDPALDDFANGDLQPGDYVMHLLHAEVGTIECLDEVMAVYRRHSGGMWSGVAVSDEWYLKYGLPFLNFHAFKEKRFSYPQPEIVRKLALGLMAAALEARNFTLLQRLAEAHPAAYERAAAALKVYGPIEERGKLWREGLNFVRRRYGLMSKVTWGGRRQRYLRKMAELNSLLEVLPSGGERD